MNSTSQFLKTRPFVEEASPYLRALVVGSLLTYLYFPVLNGIVAEWWNNANYSYGFLIPIVSLVILWNRRKEFQGIQVSPEFRGAWVFSFGLFMYLAGIAGKEEFIQRFSFPLTLLGLVYLLCGKSAALSALFPIGYSYFMIPLPSIIFSNIALHLQLLDAKVVAVVASLLGVPVFREDFILHLPEISLKVAEACGGTFSVIAFLALGVFYTHELKLKRPAKIFLCLLLIPLAVFSNIIRILVIVLVSFYSGNWVLRSSIHLLSGVFNFLVDFGALVFIAKLLEKSPKQDHS